MKLRMNTSSVNYMVKMFLLTYLIVGQVKDMGKVFAEFRFHTTCINLRRNLN